MKHIKTLTTRDLKESMKKGGCGECQTSCQSACKTSCGIANQKCENKEKAYDITAYLLKNGACNKHFNRIAHKGRKKNNHKHIGKRVDDINYSHYDHIKSSAHIA